MSDGESHKQSSSSHTSSSSLDQESSADQHYVQAGGCVEFDLSDPADLERKLESLTEEEMDDLLKQAYKVNGDLKKELNRQERTVAESSKRPSGHKRSSAGSGPSRQNSSQPSLPPIRTASGNKPAGGFRSFTTLNGRPSSNPLYSKNTSPVSPSRAKAKTAVKQPSSKHRPEWDDRFGQ